MPTNSNRRDPASIQVKELTEKNKVFANIHRRSAIGKKEEKKTETAPINWKRAQSVLKCLELEENYNTLLLFSFGFYFGLRIGDILSLRWSDIIGKQSFSIREQKTKKIRKVPIHSEVQRLIGLTFDNDQDLTEYIFTRNGNGGKAISVTAANKRIRTTFERYGIETQNPSSHTLRKTFGRRIYEINGKSEDALVLLSDIFNHANVKVTRRYIGLTEERKTKAYLSM
jgi:integrase